MEVIDFFMVKASAIKTGSNGKQYWDLMLGDKYGELTAKKWDISDREIESILNIKEKDIVKVKALITEWAASDACYADSAGRGRRRNRNAGFCEGGSGRTAEDVRLYPLCCRAVFG